MTKDNRPTETNIKGVTKIYKDSKDLAPRSNLQRWHSNVQWAIHFKLHTFKPHLLGDMPLSDRTKQLINEYNAKTHVLKMAIRVDHKDAKVAEIARRNLEEN